MTINDSHREVTVGETPAEEAVSEVVLSPFCSELRSKNYFMIDVLPTEADQYLGASGYCWCYETQQVIGPDGGSVEPDRCVPGRSCYQSMLADLA